MSDLALTLERLRESQELERLREENARLRKQLRVHEQAEEMTRLAAMHRAMTAMDPRAAMRAENAYVRGDPLNVGHIRLLFGV